MVGISHGTNFIGTLNRRWCRSKSDATWPIIRFYSVTGSQRLGASPGITQCMAKNQENWRSY